MIIIHVTCLANSISPITCKFIAKQALLAKHMLWKRISTHVTYVILSSLSQPIRSTTNSSLGWSPSIFRHPSGSTTRSILEVGLAQVDILTSHCCSSNGNHVVLKLHRTAKLSDIVQMTKGGDWSKLMINGYVSGQSLLIFLSALQKCIQSVQ